MGNPLVSIIIPLYNYQNYISDCIQSIINQNYSNYEIIVVDDCSSDNSYNVAKAFECKNIKVIKMDMNYGYSKAKNEGIIISQGDLITCLDSDDMLTINSILPRVECIERTGVSFVHAMAISVNGDISLEECYNLKKIEREEPRIHAQTVLVNRSVYKEFGLYDERLRSRSDKEMWWRLFGKDDLYRQRLKKEFIPIDVAYYRKHKKSMISKRMRGSKKEEEKLKELLENIYKERVDNISKSNTRFLEA